MFFYFLSSFLLALVVTPLVRALMRQYHVIDRPKSAERKIHKKNIALGGGLALFLSFFLVVSVGSSLGDFGQDVQVRHLIGLFCGGAILMIGGLLDDRLRLRPLQQLIAPLLAACTVILFGIGPHEITNPLGGNIPLDQWIIVFPHLGQWVVFADLLVFWWLMGVMFTTKLLDGLDGLVTGVSAIGGLMIFFLSMQAQWFQPDVARLSIAFTGVCLGFLVWNWHPATIFLGEGGSLFTGFMIGALAIISGGKIATTLLVLAIPMLDILRVLFSRIHKKRSPFEGDSEHLHFRLLQSGLSQRQTVLLFYAISFLFGITTLFLQSKEKLLALIFLLILMLLVGIWFARRDKEPQSL